jgi:hypothetical protein
VKNAPPAQGVSVDVDERGFGHGLVEETGQEAHLASEFQHHNAGVRTCCRAKQQPSERADESDGLIGQVGRPLRSREAVRHQERVGVGLRKAPDARNGLQGLSDKRRAAAADVENEDDLLGRR